MKHTGPGDGSRWLAASTAATVPALGARHRARACPTRTASGSSTRFGRGRRPRRATRAPASGCPSSRPSPRRTAARCTSRTRPSGARFVLDPARRPEGGPRGPHPDRRGRGRASPRSSPRACAPTGSRRPSPPTASPGSTTPSPATSTWSCSTSGCPAWTASRCCGGCAAGQHAAGHRADRARLASPTRSSALEGGADDYMPKPFRFAELLARVRLRLRQAQRRSRRTADDRRRRERPPRPAHPAGHGRRRAGRPVGAGVRAGRDLPAQRRPGAVAASSCSPTCGATTSTRAPTSSTSTSATCARSSAPTRSRPCAAWATGFND